MQNAQEAGRDATEGTRGSTEGGKGGCFSQNWLVLWQWRQRGDTTTGHLPQSWAWDWGIGYLGKEEGYRSETHLPVLLSYLLLGDVWVVSSQRKPAGVGGWDNRVRGLGGKLEEKICVTCWRWLQRRRGGGYSRWSAEERRMSLNLEELSEKGISYWPLQLPLPCRKSVH